MTTTTMAYTKDEILKKLITGASDGLVLDVYARIQQDRRPWGDQWIRPGAVKSWTELVHEALREGALTIEEAAFLLVETRRWRRFRGVPIGAHPEGYSAWVLPLPRVSDAAARCPSSGGFD